METQCNRCMSVHPAVGIRRDSTDYNNFFLPAPTLQFHYSFLFKASTIKHKIKQVWALIWCLCSFRRNESYIECRHVTIWILYLNVTISHCLLLSSWCRFYSLCLVKGFKAVCQWIQHPGAVIEECNGKKGNKKNKELYILIWENMYTKTACKLKKSFTFCLHVCRQLVSSLFLTTAVQASAVSVQHGRDTPFSDTECQESTGFHSRQSLQKGVLLYIRLFTTEQASSFTCPHVGRKRRSPLSEPQFFFMWPDYWT